MQLLQHPSPSVWDRWLCLLAEAELQAVLPGAQLLQLTQDAPRSRRTEVPSLDPPGASAWSPLGHGLLPWFSG